MFIESYSLWWRQKQKIQQWFLTGGRAPPGGIKKSLSDFQIFWKSEEEQEKFSQFFFKEHSCKLIVLSESISGWNIQCIVFITCELHKAPDFGANHKPPCVSSNLKKIPLPVWTSNKLLPMNLRYTQKDMVLIRACRAVLILLKNFRWLISTNFSKICEKSDPDNKLQCR